MSKFEIKENYNVDDFRSIIEILRAPDGCPWDREQTHESIRRNFLEETYEVCEAIDEGDKKHLQEELGDVLMQVIFHSRMEEEIGSFNLDDVADTACKKLIFRHPHIFGDVSVADSAEVLENWDELKRAEKAQTTVADTMQSVAKSLPALWRAEKLQKKARKAGFDWDDMIGPTAKVKEELGEFLEACDEKNADHIEEELGDLLFSVVNIGRFAGVDPETALHRCCEKFIGRFRRMENAAIEQGHKIEDLTFEEQEALYQKLKMEN